MSLTPKRREMIEGYIEFERPAWGAVNWPDIAQELLNEISRLNTGEQTSTTMSEHSEQVSPEV